MAFPLTITQYYVDMGERLYDQSNQFWSRPELLMYLQESMRLWNAMTGYWHGDFVFNPVEGQTWYDLTTLTGSLRPLTLTNTDIANIIEYHLLEPVVGLGTWMGSAQFSSNKIQFMIANRRNEIIGNTACTITETLVPATPGRITLAPTTIDIRRLAFIPSLGLGVPVTIWPDDAWSWGAFEANYAQLPQGIPNTYSTSTQPVFTFDVDRSINTPGQYELLTTQGLSDTATSLGMPDDWSWLLKWGVLSDLLGTESNAKDPLRANYAEQRYKDGLTLLRLAPALLAFRINNVPIQVDSVWGADTYNSNWEGLQPGFPQQALVAGLNLFALTPSADSNLYSLQATVVQNIPDPAVDGVIHASQDVYESLLEEAQHLAAFKMGGAEFEATVPAHQHFMQMAAIEASKQAEMGEFSAMIKQISQQQEEQFPRLQENTVEEAAGG